MVAVDNVTSFVRRLFSFVQSFSALDAELHIVSL